MRKKHQAALALPCPAQSYDVMNKMEGQGLRKKAGSGVAWTLLQGVPQGVFRTAPCPGG